MAIPKTYVRGKEITQARLDNYIPVTESGCWIWLGGWGTGGYGKLAGRKGGQATHVFYRAHVGDIPDGMIVCHKCDTPQCVNPSHLFAGTLSDNRQDMLRKGRGPKPASGISRSQMRINRLGIPRPRGELHMQAKLTEDMVRKIRVDPRKGPQICEEYGISSTHLSRIRNRKKWKHLED